MSLSWSRWLALLALGGTLLTSLVPFTAASSSLHQASSPSPPEPGPPLRLRQGILEVGSEPPSDVPPALLREPTGSQEALRLVQFPGPIQEEWREALDAAGLGVVSYVPDYGYLVWGDDGDVARARTRAPLRWEGPFQPYYALHPALSDPKALPREVEVVVQLYDHPGLDATLKEILTAGDVLVAPHPVLDYQNVTLRLPRERLAWLASLPPVVNVEPRPRRERLDELQGQIMAGYLDATGSLPLGPGYLAWLEGLGFPNDPAAYPIVDVIDDGFDNGVASNPAHLDFRVAGESTGDSRVVWAEDYTGDGPEGTDGHGNINVSIIGGYNTQSGFPHEDDAGYNYGLGINPFGRMASRRVFDDEGWWATGGVSDSDIARQSYVAGARITSNSWGAETNGAYTASDQEWDVITRDADPTAPGNQELINLFAAGNSGSGGGTMGSPGNAKNVITVGASENVRPGWTDGCFTTSSEADDAQDIAPFSSRGPTVDGRSKPDLVAPGTHVQGAASQDPSYTGAGVCDAYYPPGQTLYASSSGTSHSTPAAAGAASLVYSYYRDGLSAQPPSPAMMKAYLALATRYLGGTGAGDTLPSDNQGYGGIDLSLAFDDVSRVVVDQSELLGATGNEYEVPGRVVDGSRPFRVALAWTDAPGSTVGASYVNDLDLLVTVGGLTYRGNVFSGAVSAPGGSADPRNNLETVFLPAGVTGPFTVRVVASNIAGDGVPGNGDFTDQDFALVVHNGTRESGRLHGTVRDGGGAPVSGATVEASGLSEFTTTTDASGAYTLTVHPDTYTVRGWAYGYDLAQQEGVVVANGDSISVPLTLNATALHSLSGCVTDAVTGAPLAATLTVRGPFGEVVTETVTLETGCYALDLRGGPYTLAASARLHETSEVSLDLNADLTRDFALAPTTSEGLLWGRVTNAETGGPVAGGTVSVSPGLTQTLTGADGSYELRLPPGSYTVTASAPLYAPVVEVGVAVPRSNLVERNYALPSAHLLLHPSDGLSNSQMLGEVATPTLLLENVGSLPLTFDTMELKESFIPSSERAYAGGPDPYGYTYADSREPDGPLFEWEDATDGTPLDLEDDTEASVEMPFPFDFYGVSSQWLRVGNNGALLFGATTGDVSYANDALSSSFGEDYLIAPFWDDLDDETGNVYYKTVGAFPRRRFIVEWHERPHWNGIGAATLQVIFHEGTNNLEFQYQDVDFGDVEFDGGASATVGIRGASEEYLQYSLNAPALEGGLSICFRYPGSPPCDILDVEWLSVEPVSGTVASGTSRPVAVGLDAGVVDQPGDYVATLRFLTDDPAYHPHLDYPITMTVQPTGGLGRLHGTVSSDRPGGPLGGALVEVISGTTTAFSTTTGLDGAYVHWLPAGSHEVLVSAAGYREERATLSIAESTSTRHDVLLRLLAPAIGVTPRELAVDQLPDSVVTRTLTLSNSGGAELNYTVLEMPPHLTPSVVPPSASDTPTGEVAVSPAVLQALEEEGRADFWVRFAGRADLRPAYGMGWQERGRFVVKALQEVAGASQAEARAYLEGAGADHAPHWIVNAILVRGGDASLLRRLRAMAGVESIHETRNLPVPEPVEARPFSSFHLNLAPEWGLAMIRAPEAWALARGEGVVVANVDTGVRYTHEALVNQYRGNSNGEFDHDFNWYDPQGEVAPVDDNGHGTHTMGTMVGDDGAENQVGVAPGARWIAADGCDATDCPDVDLVGSAEWILAPCPVGVLPGDVRCDVDRRPHVVNNSWGDCELATTEFFEEAIDAWRAAGIFTVFSNGNTGNCEYSSAFCGSLGNPARHYQVTSVGATDEYDDVAAFSLWGPSDDPDPRLAEYADVKPEVSAPGHYVRSAYRRTDSDYVMMKGTSMAAPHVSGIAALVLSAGPAFTGEHDALEDLLKETAVARPYTTTCGNEGPGQVPNNAFGWGRVDALAAVERAVVLSDVPWLEVGAPTGTVPIDGSVGLPVTLDARGLPEGLYTATLRVQHDDPYAALIDVQVAMRVWSDQLYLPLIHR